MKQFELSTKNGKFRLLSSDEIQVREIDVIEPLERTNGEENYKACVLECHKILDEIGISSEKELCEDPQCKSSLGHRLRKLRDKNNRNQSLLDEIVKLVESSEYDKVKELLTKSREH